jgi:hypothetical protein
VDDDAYNIFHVCFDKTTTSTFVESATEAATTTGFINAVRTTTTTTTTDNNNKTTITITINEKEEDK